MSDSWAKTRHRWHSLSSQAAPVIIFLHSISQRILQAIHFPYPFSDICFYLLIPLIAVRGLMLQCFSNFFLHLGNSKFSLLTTFRFYSWTFPMYTSFVIFQRKVIVILPTPHTQDTKAFFWAWRDAGQITGTGEVPLINVILQAPGVIIQVACSGQEYYLPVVYPPGWMNKWGFKDDLRFNCPSSKVKGDPILRADLPLSF